MRVGLIIYGSLETISGGYLYDRRLVAYLRACGDQVTVISLPWRSYGQHVLDNWRRWGWDSAESAPIPGLVQGTSLDQILTQHTEGFDLLLQDELNHPSLAWLNPTLRRRLNCPLVAIVHHLRSSERHPPLFRHLYHAVEKRYLSTIDAFICNSRTTQRTVVACLRDPRPLLVAPPGGDRFAPSVSAPEPPPPPPLRLLFVGNIIRRKGLHTLLRALIALPSSLVELAVVGNPRLEPRYSAACRRFSARNRLPVRWAGILTDEALAKAYAASHVLVAPSAYEGFGIAYLEAMGLGLPIIAGSAGAAAELVTPGVNGYLVSPDEVGALTHHLATLAGAPALLTQLRANARAAFATQATWSDSMARVRDFLLAQIAP